MTIEAGRFLFLKASYFMDPGYYAHPDKVSLGYFHLSMQIKPANRPTEIKPCHSLGVAILIPKAKGTLSG